MDSPDGRLSLRVSSIDDIGSGQKPEFDGPVPVRFTACRRECVSERSIGRGDGPPVQSSGKLQSRFGVNIRSI